MRHRALRNAIALLASLFLVSLSPGMAFADYNYSDQINEVRTAYVQSSSIYAQTFTQLATGPLLGVSVALVTTGGVNVTVTIEDTMGNPPVPKDGALASAHGPINFPSVSWATFDLPEQPVLVAGHVYAIVVFTTDNAQVWGSTGNAYTRGRALVLHSLAWTPLQEVYPTGPDDLSFQTIVRHIDPTATPTPAPPLAPTVAPTAAPTVAPTVAPTAAPTDTPAAATDTPTAVPAPTDTPAMGGGAAPTPDPGAGGSGSGSGSGGLDGLMIPILAALILVLVVAGGGFLLLRMRR